MLFRVEFEWCVDQSEAAQFVSQLKDGFRGKDPALLALPSTASLATVQIEPCDVGGYQFVRAVYRVGQQPTK
jgi:hypothetical protein